MIEKMIEYFSKKHFFTNFFLIVVFIGGIFSWQYMSKEELPDVTFESIRVSVSYPGAPAEDVEYFVTDPIEEQLQGIDGVYRITSNTGVGSCSISIDLEPGYPDLDEAMNEIRNEVAAVRLPDDITDDPRIRLFKTSRKAIIDVAVIHTGHHLLDTDARQELQSYALALENRLLSLAEVNSVNRRGFLQEELQVKVDPAKLIDYEIPLNKVKKEISNNHVRQPAGTIEAEQEPKVTLLSELKDVDSLKELIVQGGFEGGVIRLGDLAEVEEGYEKSEHIIKVNGHEAVFFSVVKNSSVGILDALDAVERSIEKFRDSNIRGTPIKVVLLDDESVDIRNRLSIISLNGIIGFFLILGTLFIFLDISAGLWVAMGIPFTFCLTLIISAMLGYTINGTTLAAVIIVMGIIVDDAIVVAENITRTLKESLSRSAAAVKGTSFVLLPIIASIVTTCIAFVPLFFFTGRFGKFIEFMPPVIFIMLGASFIESILILPGHMALKIPFFDKFSNGNNKGEKHWFEKVEDKYCKMLSRLLPHSWLVLAGFLCLLIFSFFLVKTHFQFVMFPREETRELVIAGYAPPGTVRQKTAELTKQIENRINPMIGTEVVGVRNDIARGRRGGAVEENKFRMIVEIVPKEKRKRSADQVLQEIKLKVKDVEGFEDISFRKSRWGQSTGSALEIYVQQNDDAKRRALINDLKSALEADPAFFDVEIDEGLNIPEYRIHIKQERAKRLAINPSDIAATLRSALEGSILYDFKKEDEEVQLRFTTINTAKDDIEKVLDIPVENNGNYLVPLRDVVDVEKRIAQGSIYRRSRKRTTVLYADIKKGAGLTPLEAAEKIEQTIFSDLLSKYPTANLSFGGEVQDTRESRRDLVNAVILAIVLIYSVLAVLFQSVIKPFVIMLVIPFGVVGIVLAFWLHGKTLFGFYAAIGALGLAGVVINDSIIMMVKMDSEFDNRLDTSGARRQIAFSAGTRLRAVILTTLTTVAGILPTAYGFAGYDAMLAEMMLALTWGLVFGTVITLIMVPCVYSAGKDVRRLFKPGIS